MADKLTIGFLGAGKMAQALANGVIRARLVTSKEVVAADPSKTARKAFSQDTGARTTASNLEVVQSSSLIILAVKPDQVSAALAEIREALTKDHVLLSIAAGVPLAKLEAGV